MVLVALLHLGLFWLATRPAPHVVTSDHRVWVQLLLPALPLTSSLTSSLTAPKTFPVPVRPALPAAQPPASTAPAAATATATAANKPAPSVEPKQAAPSAPPADPLADPLASKEAASPARGDILQQALKAVGAIDRQLRLEHPQQFTAPPDSPRARLIKGLAAAHAAVGPKWYEAARAELISAPNDPKRVYRITSALGEYCLYYPDKGSISANASTKGGAADFGQPTISTCPIPF